MNTTPAPQVTDDISQNQVQPNVEQSGGGTGKEKEAFSKGPGETITAVPAEIEIPQELTERSVEQIGGVIELPPDVKKLGVTQTGASTPVTTPVQPLPAVNLPISDDAVFADLSAQVTSAARWLGEWCVKKLLQAHVMLKVIHGKVTRIKIK